MKRYEDAGQAIAYDNGVTEGMMRGDEAWKVSQLAATLLAGAINPDTGPCNMTEAIAAAQQILAAARKAVRQ